MFVKSAVKPPCSKVNNKATMMYFIGSFEYRVTFLVKIRRFNGHRKWTFCILGSGSWANFQADRLYKSNDTYQYKCGGVKACKKGRGLASGC